MLQPESARAVLAEAPLSMHPSGALDPQLLTNNISLRPDSVFSAVGKTVQTAAVSESLRNSQDQEGTSWSISTYAPSTALNPVMR